MGKRLIIVWLLVLACCLGGCKRGGDKAIAVYIGPYTELRDSMAKWQLAHPDVPVRVMNDVGPDDLFSLSELGPDHLPDVMVTDDRTGRAVVRTTGGLLPAPGAFRALRPDAVVVVYDKTREFEPVAYCSWLDLLSCVLADGKGQDWLTHIVDKDFEAAFTDAFFGERLRQMQDLLRTMPQVTPKDFVSGKCPAILVAGNTLYSLLNQVKKQSPELYERLEFRPLSGRAVPSEYCHAVYFNNKTMGQPGRRELCLSISRVLTVNRNDPPVPDATCQRLYDLLDASPQATPVRFLLDRRFWNQAGQQVFTQLKDGDKTLPEYAAILQDLYEQYYF